MDSSAKLNDGHPIPRIGLGVYQTAPGESSERAVRAALDAGYRHIDTAAIYQNESSVGAALKASKLDRSEVYLTTKLWNDDHGDPAAAFERSRARLDVDYVDLYLIHWPVQGKRVAAWSKLEQLIESGKVRSIGVSNYLVPHLRELLAIARVVPAVNQIELTPYNYRSRLDTVKLCRENGVQVEAYSPLTRGQKLRDPKLIAVAQRYQKSPAQILIRWGLQHELVVLPKSSRPERIRENFDVFDFELSGDDMAALDALDENLTVAWDPVRQA